MLDADVLLVALTDERIVGVAATHVEALAAACEAAGSGRLVLSLERQGPAAALRLATGAAGSEAFAAGAGGPLAVGARGAGSEIRGILQRVRPDLIEGIHWWAVA